MRLSDLLARERVDTQLHVADKASALAAVATAARPVSMSYAFCTRSQRLSRSIAQKRPHTLAIRPTPIERICAST